MNKCRYPVVFVLILLVSSFFIQGCATTAGSDEGYEPGSSEGITTEPVSSPDFGSADVSASTDDAGSPDITSPGDRLIIYNAHLSMVVENISDTLSKIRNLTVLYKGYMKSMDSRSIAIKVPSVKFNLIIKELENYGEVTNKQIHGKDVTAEMLDLNIRLENAEKLRKRFIYLLEKTKKIEDAIQIEKELARVTETIETLKGKIRYLKNQIAYSTITVRLNSALPQNIVKEKIPFRWVRELGKEISKGGVQDYYKGSRSGGIRFKLPESFVKYYESKNLARATSAEGVLIKVQRHYNAEGASLKFWTDLTKRSLLIKQTIHITETRDIQMGKKGTATIIQGTKEIGNQKFVYLVCILMGKRSVITYEAWGRMDDFENKINEIEESIESLRM